MRRITSCRLSDNSFRQEKSGLEEHSKTRFLYLGELSNIKQRFVRGCAEQFAKLYSNLFLKSCTVAKNMVILGEEAKMAFCDEKGAVGLFITPRLEIPAFLSIIWCPAICRCRRAIG